MIIDSFDNETLAKINPVIQENRIKCDACIITFSYVIEKYVLDKFKPEEIGQIKTVNGFINVYKIEYKGKKFAFYKTILGAPTAVGCVENVIEFVDTQKFIVFGGSGCLNKEIARGKIMIPTEAYRDEGMSYHYVEPSDYITIKNANVVEEFFKSININHILGRTWTTDAFFRETEKNFEIRKNDGCISVEMECSAYQAMCDFRNLELYYFLSSGDLLDSPEWDDRIKDKNDFTGTQHDSRLFDLAIELADFVTR